MRALVTAVVSVVVPVTVWIAVGSAQSTKCPPEVASAKAILTARGGEIQASRPGRNENNQAAARSLEIQRPRQQDAQAPRAKEEDVQAPRTSKEQDVQAPRTSKEQDVQAPRAKQDAQTPRGQDAARDQNVVAGEAKRAETLVKEAEEACKTGDTARASQKAMAALEILRK